MNLNQYDQEKTMEPMDGSAIYDNADAFVISSHHVSGPGMHILCEVKYVPSHRAIVCKTIATVDPAPRYEVLCVPAEIHTADELMAFVSSQKPWFPFGYKLDEVLKQRIDATL